MKYKECLLFVGKCLTLDVHPERIQEIREAINKNAVNWENVVRLSSGQYVLPAMYLQLKRNGLLTELPADLAEHLEEITNLNRERNLSILEQAKEITEILNAQNISPVFLKGVGHLLGGLYTDIAERMIGDIDFLVQEEKMVEAAELLIDEGYQPLTEYIPEMFKRLKHYPRLQNFKYPASVEIHKEVLNPRYQKIFRGFELIHEKQPVAILQNQAFIPSIKHLIIHNVINAQISDKSFIYGNVLLRQIYDLWLLSLKDDIIKIAKNYGKKFNIFNTYFATIDFVFSSPKGIKYQNTTRTNIFMKRMNLFLSYPKYIHSIYKTIIFLTFRIINYIKYPILSIFQKDTRKLLVNLLTDRKWYAYHLRSYLKFF
ncbi:MAG: nucleotidyltransferase family protein, partial [Mariniphaga sp.]|nr:nucleotidyltransferase family protein [Mariniphaga sp.]